MKYGHYSQWILHQTRLLINNGHSADFKPLFPMHNCNINTPISVAGLSIIAPKLSKALLVDKNNIRLIIHGRVSALLPKNNCLQRKLCLLLGLIRRDCFQMIDGDLLWKVHS